MKKLLAIILSLCLIITCFAACSGDSDDSSDVGVTTTTKAESNALRMPEENIDGLEAGSFESFNAVDMTGKKYNSDIFKGKKLTMINIWATFCNPCIGEMPDIEKLSEKYADKGFQVVGIISDVTNGGDGAYNKFLLEDAADVIESTGVTYLNLLPSKSLNYIKLDEVYAVPETIFVDENGKVVGESYTGSRSFEQWEAIVNELLETM